MNNRLSTRIRKISNRPAKIKSIVSILVGVGLIFSFLIPSSFAAATGFVKARAANGRVMDALPNQVIVKYRRGRSVVVKSRLAKTFSTAITTHKQIESLETELLSIPQGETVDSFVEHLQSDPDVEFAEPNGIVREVYSPNDPKFLDLSQWGLLANRLDMPDAWEITKGSSTIVIAVIDTGVTGNLVDLRNQLIPSTGTTIGIDWAGNGNYTDDYACISDPVLNPGGFVGRDLAPNNQPVDDNYDDCFGDTNIYHGTRVSSIIAAQANNNVAIAGIAFNCKLMDVKALNNKGSGSFESVSAGITYAVDHGANVINMSLGSDFPSATMSAAVQYALDHNVVVVAASGNLQFGQSSCLVNYPGAIPGVISVGATDINDNLASFSCTGDGVGHLLTLVAPGVNIVSVTSTTVDNENGTSFASPMVAAVAGLIRSLRPAMTTTEVARNLTAFADQHTGLSQYNNSYGWGRLNAFKTLTAVNQGIPPPNPPSDLASPGKTFPGTNPFYPMKGKPVVFHWPDSDSAMGKVGLEIKIFNLAGETVKTLSGTSSWDGKNEEGNYVASGLYFYYLKTSKGNKTGKLTVIK